MTVDQVEDAVRRSIGGDAPAVAWITGQANASDDALVLTMAALLVGDPALLDRARVAATTSRERQLVAIAQAHVDGATDLVDVLARDHLVDYPASLIVAWIASGAVVARRGEGPDAS